MLDREFVIGTRDRALQQTPDVLNAVRMNVTTDIFFRTMVDDFVFSVGISNPTISSPIVGDDDFRIGCRMIFDEPMQRLPIRSVNNLQSDFAASLDDADYNGLFFR